MSLTGHWKKTCNLNYLGSHDLASEKGYSNIIVTIADIVTEEVLEPSTNKKSICTVISFKENYKPMILNSTNKKAIAKVAGNNFVEKWIGIKIKIEVKQVKAFGETHDALRISNLPPVVDMAKCEYCGKEVQKSVLDGIKAKHGYAVCSIECLEKIKESK